MDDRNLEVLYSSPPIIERIFKYVSAKDLSSCSQVCTIWRSLAEVERNRRKTVDFICYPQVIPTSRVQFLDDNVGLEILKENIQDVFVHPTFCLAFCTTDLLRIYSQNEENSEEVRVGRKKRRLNQTTDIRLVLSDFIETPLPSNCKGTLISAPGIIGTDLQFKPQETERGIAFSSYYFPKIPGVKVNYFPFPLNVDDASQLLPPDLKCILLFLTQCSTRVPGSKFFADIMNNTGGKAACGGAYVNHVEASPGTVITFSGDNIEAASIIIKQEEKELQIVEKLKLFEQSGMLSNKCVAFMFACLGRGYALYRRNNIESQIFSRMCPNVPIIGVFGNGEIGASYVPRVLESKKTRRYIHGYSTIFVLLSMKI